MPSKSRSLVVGLTSAMLAVAGLGVGNVDVLPFEKATKKPKSDKPKEPKVEKAKKEPKEKKAKGFNFKGSGAKKPPKAGSKREKVINLTSRANGATEAEIAEVTKRPRETLFILASQHGYSFEQAEGSSRIRCTNG